jgi:hypothetical protein
MRLFPATLASFICLVFVPGGRAELQDALVARQVLADFAATCVVRIEYDPSLTARPPVFATAFRLENVLWLYAPEIGTRALGPATHAWPDSAKLSTRLRQLDPAIRRVTVYSNPVAPLVRQEKLYLNNACVIASLQSLGRVLDLNDRVTDAGLILMAFDTTEPANAPAFLVNHCVLAYRRDGRWWCLDPNQAQPFPLNTIAIGAPLDPALVTLALQQSYPLKSVHLLPLSPATLDRVATNMRWRDLAVIK